MRIAEAVRAHPDGGIFLSLFRARKQTTLTAACLVAEMGDERGRYPTVEVLAASRSGMSPVAVESGKRKVAGFRRACDKRLRKAVSDPGREHAPSQPLGEGGLPEGEGARGVRARARDKDPWEGVGKGDLQDVAGREALRS